MIENEISRIVLDAAIAVHRELGGPGLLESYYELALAEELRLTGLKLGLVINFGQERLISGFERVVNGLQQNPETANSACLCGSAPLR